MNKFKEKINTIKRILDSMLEEDVTACSNPPRCDNSTPTRSDIASDLRHYQTNENFIAWMRKINNMTREGVLSLTLDDYINGYCEDWAVYHAVRYNVPVLFLSEAHNLIKIGDRYYDGFNIFGSEFLCDLEFVIQSECLSKLSEVELQSLLKEDNEWKTYKPLADNVGMIEKFPLKQNKKGEWQNG